MCVIDGGGWKTECQLEFWLSLPGRKRVIHSALHLQAHILALQTPLSFSLESLNRGAKNSNRSRELDYVLEFRAAVVHLGHSSFLVCRNRIGQHGLSHENLLKAHH